MAVAFMGVNNTSMAGLRPQSQGQRVTSAISQPRSDADRRTTTGSRGTGQTRAKPAEQQAQQKQQTTKSMDELLTCKICLIRYSADADGGRLPRQLDCRHVFCHSCLVDCDLAERVKYVIPCPLCKKRTILAKDKVLGLPINKQLLSVLKKTEKDEAKVPSSDQVVNKKPSALKGSSSTNLGVQQPGKSKSVLFNPEVDEAIVDEMSVISLTSDSSHSPSVQKNGSSQVKKGLALAVKPEKTPVAVVKQHWRLHPPPNQSTVPGEIDENEGASADSENQAPGSSLSNQEDETIVTDDVIDTAENVGYPLHDLHELAPQHLLDDLQQNTDPVKTVAQFQLLGEGVTQHATGSGDNPHVSYTSLLSDLHLMQPTTSSYISSFGKYGQIRTQPGAFSCPTKISCSVEHKLVIVDVANETVQAFSTSGECLAIFAVRDVKGACFINESLLAVASNRGIELYGINGRLTKSIPVSPAVAVARTNDGGFVAAHKRSLSVGKTPASSVRLHTINGTRKVGALSRAAVFEDVSDVAVSQRNQICVLDGCSIFIIDENGILISVINYGVPLDSPTLDTHSLTAKCQPFALAVDPKTNQLIVSANRYISRFSLEDGSFQRCLINLDDQVTNDKIRAFGVAANGAGQLFIVLRADGIAETAIFNM